MSRTMPPNEEACHACGYEGPLAGFARVEPEFVATENHGLAKGTTTTVRLRFRWTCRLCVLEGRP